ncbi:MAG: hypothetical protein SGBAC_011907, partial [Bacillariaceae sp.]
MKGYFDVCSYQENSEKQRLLNSRYKHKQDDKDNEKNQEMDVMLSQAFNRLTFDQRQEQQDLLHGVDNELTEGEDFVDNSLQHLDNYLMCMKNGSVYETAEKMDPEFVGSRAFRIMFLRGNRYDTKAAADQMLRFFVQKQKLFGREKLVKDITMDDLDEDDRACFRSGCIQIVGKDRSNRHILLQIPGLRLFKTLLNELRVRYYIMMRLLEREEAQKRGAIFVVYTVGDLRDKREGGGYLENHNLSAALPLHSAAFHVCTDDFAQSVLGNLVVRVMPAEARARFRLHYGTHLECQYLLSTYGIPSELLPLSPKVNGIDMESHLRWYRSCFTDGTDELNHPQHFHLGPTNEPNPHDVLSMGSTRSDNLGNEHLRVLVKDHANAYSSGTNEDKRRVVDGIIDDIHESGGRFLKKVKGSENWAEESLVKVREKITQRFRNYNRRRVTVWQTVRGGVTIADLPLPNDVIFGRAQKSKGNELLHRLIKDRSEAYDSLSRGIKAVV